MLRIISILLLTILIFSFKDDHSSLLNKKVPVVFGKTIGNKAIDSTYFKNKVTLVCFFYIGCPACMNELRALNKLKRPANFQILYIVPQTANQLLWFNGSWKNVYSNIRKMHRIDYIKDDLLPECSLPMERFELGAANTSIGPECSVISKLFKVYAYPQSFLVDKKGIIRKTYIGFANDSNDSLNTIKIQKDVRVLL